MASTSVAWTPSSSGNRDKWTWSGWVKRSSLGEQVIFGCYQNGSYMTELKFSTSDEIHFEDTYNTNTNGRIITTAKFRDLSAWYHIVAVFDRAAGSSASDKIKVYVNGVNQEGSYGNAPQWSTTLNSSGQKIQHGQLGAGSNFDGYMSHCHFCDGYAYQASDFGETDSTTGEWKIKTSPSVSYGTNGFWILKDGNSVTDESPNSNNFTVEAGTLTKSEDNPSNVFATLNPLVPTGGGFQGNSSTFANGSNKFTTNNSSSNYGLTLSTLGMTTGKYYAECKKISGGQGTIGIRGWQGTSTNNYLGDTARDYGMYTNGRVYSNNSMVLDTSTSYADNDIIGVFVDCDNWKIYWSKNGTMMNTTGYTIGDITADTNVRNLGAYFFGCCEWNSSGNGSWEWNFGNGAFGSTQLTGTTYTGSDGNGIFKYDPNNITLDSTSKSFKSLSTKGLNT